MSPAGEWPRGRGELNTAGGREQPAVRVAVAGKVMRAGVLDLVAALAWGLAAVAMAG